MKRASRIASALMTALALAACDTGNRAERLQRHRVEGIVQDVDVEHGQALIDHEEIPGFMPAMTMSYDVPDAAALAQLAAGQRIAFTLEVRDQSFRLTEVRVLEAKAAPGRSGALGAVAEEAELAPDFALTDQEGRTVTLASLRGKTVLLDFIYTHCPGPCPILTGRHAQVQRELAPEARARTHFVSISVDPERDSPEVLRAYATARGADLAGWSFLTGDPEAVREVLTRYGVFAQESARAGEVDHVVVTLVIDAEGRIARRLFGTEGGIADVKAALASAAS